MAYVRKKKTKGREYYQLVEGRRENGKVKQRVLAHLGDCPTVAKALRWWPMRIVKMWRLARDARKSVENIASLMAKDLTEKGEGYRKLALHFVDEDGEVRRRKLSPHELHQARYRDEVLGHKYYQELAALGMVWQSRHDLFLRWQAEYWHAIDYAERLEREAGELEERYAKLYAINGGTSEEARQLLRDRFQRLLDAYERHSRRLEALRQEKRVHWLKSRGLEEDADPARQLLYALHGSQVDIEKSWANKDK